MVEALLIMGGLALLLGAGLGLAAHRFRVEGDPLADRIDALLPQTQCGQCGYAGCRPYAEAIARGDAPVNRCPPGGEAVGRALAELMGVEYTPPGTGAAVPASRELARIDPETCIGCTLCLQACPVDAIVGAARQLHVVLPAECTGCRLCLPPCPVECITMHAVDEGLDGWHWRYPVQRLTPWREPR